MADNTSTGDGMAAEKHSSTRVRLILICATCGALLVFMGIVGVFWILDKVTDDEAGTLVFIVLPLLLVQVVPVFGHLGLVPAVFRASQLTESEIRGRNFIAILFVGGFNFALLALVVFRGYGRISFSALTIGVGLVTSAWSLPVGGIIRAYFK